MAATMTLRRAPSKRFCVMKTKASSMGFSVPMRSTVSMACLMSTPFC